MLGHASDTCGFKTAVGPYAINDRQSDANFVLRKLKNATLFIEAAGGYLRRVGVNRYRR